MSLFCPHAPRPLLRAAVQGALRRGASKTTKTTTTTTAVSWAQYSTSHQRGPLFYINKSVRSQLRLRNSLTAIGCGSQGAYRTFFTERIVRRYEDLPRDYQDKRGLEFRGSELSEAEIERIFGPDIGASTANHLLRILHGRRVAGTLDDPVFAVHTAQFSAEDMKRAMEYLRKNVPVDEVMNAGLRAEDELNEMDEAKEHKPKKTEDGEAAAEEEVEYHEDPLYGKSSFDQIRAKNIAKEKARQKALEEEAERMENEGLPDDPSQRSLVEVEEGQRAITNPKVAEYYKAAQGGLKEAPEMSLWERIAPSLVTVTLAIGFFASLCMVYEQPHDKYRLLQEIPIETATLGTIVTLNLLVYFGWKFPPLWRTFNKYMLLVVGLPKPISLFTSIFSHKQLSHLLMNMTPLCLVGMYMHEELGRATFLTLYLASGSLGFLGSLVVYGARGMLGVSTLGASGATLGVLVAWFWDHRMDPFRILGLPESGVHGIVYWALIVGVHLAGLGRMFSNKDRLDMVSHLCGIVAGMVGIEIVNWAGLGRKKEQKKETVETDETVVQDLVIGDKAVLGAKAT